MTLRCTPTPAGDVGQLVENGLTLPFRYDLLDRLGESSGWFTYGYDGNGNRSSEWLEGTLLSYGYTCDRVKDASTPGATPVKQTPSSVTPDASTCTLDTQLASVSARFKYDFRNRRWS